MTTININKEKNGIEITFDGKPSAQVITALKAYGFRWSSYQGFWWARNTEERLSFAQSLEDCEVCSKYGNGKEKPYNLFDMTRTDEIGNNYEKYHLHDTKEIAAIIRKHIRERFKMCKWSVTSGTHEISVKMKGSPWDKESPEVNAIADYVYAFAQSYNYDNSDSMTDYFDVNFYGVYRSDIISRYEYEQREETVAEHNISEQFKIDLAAFEKAEEERKEREYQEMLKQMEIDRQRAAEIEKRREAEAAEIEAHHISEDCDMWVMNVRLVANKDSNLNCADDEYFTNRRRVNCKIARKVTFTESIYNLFIEHLITDFSFLAQMGGTRTDDERIQNDEDYRRMSKEERETVEWYNFDCVAIYCGDELKLVVDPQGSNYARYVYMVDEESDVRNEYKGDTGISEEELKENKAAAGKLMAVINDIFVNNEYCKPETIAHESFDMFRVILIDVIRAMNLRFDAETIRAVDNISIKIALYRVLNEPMEVQKQFAAAPLFPGRRITVIQISDFGSMTVNQVVYESHKNGKYAQYDKAVELIFKQPRKRGLFGRWLYRDVLIYDNWLEIPDSLMWETSDNGNGVIVRKSRFLSCDKKQYDVILDYFKEKGLKPIINTYKPIF